MSFWVIQGALHSRDNVADKLWRVSGVEEVYSIPQLLRKFLFKVIRHRDVGDTMLCVAERFVASGVVNVSPFPCESLRDVVYSVAKTY